MERQTPVQSSQNNRHDPSSAPTNRNHDMPVPMEEGEIDSETDQEPLVLEVPAIIGHGMWEQKVSRM